MEIILYHVSRAVLLTTSCLCITDNQNIALPVILRGALKSSTTILDLSIFLFNTTNSFFVYFGLLLGRYTFRTVMSSHRSDFYHFEMTPLF